jgi:hypothetical protein
MTLAHNYLTSCSWALLEKPLLKTETINYMGICSEENHKLPQYWPQNGPNGRMSGLCWKMKCSLTAAETLNHLYQQKNGKPTCLWNHELIGKLCERYKTSSFWSLRYGMTVMPTCCLWMLCHASTSILHQLKYLGQGHTSNLPSMREYGNDIGNVNHKDQRTWKSSTCF